ncbi:carboxypeptidase-like regulatory domain-containing protein [Azohydromonas lata]|uniref:carboxypeptidase-like regulatory domain-containing protein n=1 Tax=Azohydromonas lata TaxID=45677 RepID=UPI0012F4C6BD|nr:carboxypeptidase-like regulatory domain-containing protein [Azohydromonas lata]
MRPRARRAAWLPAMALALAAAGCVGCARQAQPQVPAGVGGGPGAAVAAAQGVSGRVVDGAGRPVAGALIEARSLERPPRPLAEIGVLSGADGRFKWPLPAGTRAALRARLGDAVSCERDATAGAAEVVLTLPAPAAGCAPLS